MKCYSFTCFPQKQHAAVTARLSCRQPCKLAFRSLNLAHGLQSVCQGLAFLWRGLCTYSGMHNFFQRLMHVSPGQVSAEPWLASLRSVPCTGRPLQLLHHVEAVEAVYPHFGLCTIQTGQPTILQKIAWFYCDKANAKLKGWVASGPLGTNQGLPVQVLQRLNSFCSCCPIITLQAPLRRCVRRSSPGGQSCVSFFDAAADQCTTGTCTPTPTPGCSEPKKDTRCMQQGSCRTCSTCQMTRKK